MDGAAEKRNGIRKQTQDTNSHTVGVSEQSVSTNKHIKGQTQIHLPYHTAERVYPKNPWSAWMSILFSKGADLTEFLWRFRV